MKKILIIALLILIPSTVFGLETWRVHWNAITAGTQNAQPSLYTNISKGKQDTGGARLIDDTKSIMVTCFTVGDNATSTDFNLMYDNQTANGFELCSAVGANSSCGRPVTVAGHHIRLSADNDDSVDSVTPYCEITFR